MWSLKMYFLDVEYPFFPLGAPWEAEFIGGWVGPFLGCGVVWCTPVSGEDISLSAAAGTSEDGKGKSATLLSDRKRVG